MPLYTPEHRDTADKCVCIYIYMLSGFKGYHQIAMTSRIFISKMLITLLCCPWPAEEPGLSQHPVPFFVPFSSIFHIFVHTFSTMYTQTFLFMAEDGLQQWRTGKDDSPKCPRPVFLRFDSVTCPWNIPSCFRRCWAWNEDAPGRWIRRVRKLQTANVVGETLT